MLTSRYELLYRHTADEPYLPSHRLHSFSRTVVNAHGSLAFSEFELLRPDPKILRRVLYLQRTPDGDPEVVKENFLFGGYPDSGSRNCGVVAESRSLDLNDHGDLAWGMWIQPKEGPAFDIPPEGSDYQMLYSLMRDARDRLAVYFAREQRDSEVQGFFRYQDPEGTSELPLRQFAPDFVGVETMRVNRDGLALGVYKTGAVVAPDDRAIFLMQLPRGDGTPLSYREVRRLGWLPDGSKLCRPLVALNDRGDYAYCFRAALSRAPLNVLVIQRAGRACLTVTDEGGARPITHLEINQRGDVFVLPEIGYPIQLLQFPADGGGPIDLTPILPRRNGLPVRLVSVSASGPYLALTAGKGKLEPQEVLLFRES